MSEERARQAAESARYRLGLAGGRVEVFRAITDLGIRLLRYPVEHNALEGAYLRRGPNTYILVNSKTRLTRQRFTAAHELGHHFLHPDRDLQHYDADLLEPADRDANAFAAYFLMDEATTRRVTRDESDALRQAFLVYSTFEVSLEAAAMHLERLGLIAAVDREAIVRRRDRARNLRSLAESVGLVVGPEPRPRPVIDPGDAYRAGLRDLLDAGLLSRHGMADLLRVST